MQNVQTKHTQLTASYNKLTAAQKLQLLQCSSYTNIKAKKAKKASNNKFNANAAYLKAYARFLMLNCVINNNMLLSSISEEHFIVKQNAVALQHFVQQKLSYYNKHANFSMQIIANKIAQLKQHYAQHALTFTTCN
jgi:hypothetical protein